MSPAPPYTNDARHNTPMTTAMRDVVHHHGDREAGVVAPPAARRRHPYPQRHHDDVRCVAIARATHETAASWAAPAMTMQHGTAARRRCSACGVACRS
jgi:hypothetical protein